MISTLGSSAYYAVAGAGIGEITSLFISIPHKKNLGAFMGAAFGATVVLARPLCERMATSIKSEYGEQSKAYRTFTRAKEHLGFFAGLVASAAVLRHHRVSVSLESMAAFGFGMLALPAIGKIFRFPIPLSAAFPSSLMAAINELN